MSSLTRMWINQPSTKQPFHDRHGTNVLVENESTDYKRVYFLSGEVFSMRIPTSALSVGWKGS